MLPFALALPTLDAEFYLDDLLKAIGAQTARPAMFLVIDSSSTDRTVELAEAAGAKVITIPRSAFNHGGTRTRALEMLREYPVSVFLTQDTKLQDRNAFSRLVSAFEDMTVAAAYGRQLPRREAKEIESFARTFNYPEDSEVRSLSDSSRLGIKTCFASNSFAAYRTQTLLECGGFPDNVILGEDVLAFAKLLTIGQRVAYVADAVVEHSHGYTILEEFRRYFDIGVMHKQSSDILSPFNQSTGPGAAFVLAELEHLLRCAAILIPEALIRTASKFAAYQLGRAENYLPVSMKRKLSMHSRFWK